MFQIKWTNLQTLPLAVEIDNRTQSLQTGDEEPINADIEKFRLIFYFHLYVIPSNFNEKDNKVLSYLVWVIVPFNVALHP